MSMVGFDGLKNKNYRNLYDGTVITLMIQKLTKKNTEKYVPLELTNGNLVQTSDRRKPKYESESDMSNGYEMKEKDRTYESSFKKW